MADLENRHLLYYYTIFKIVGKLQFYEKVAVPICLTQHHCKRGAENTRNELSPLIPFGCVTLQLKDDCLVGWAKGFPISPPPSSLPRLLPSEPWWREGGGGGGVSSSPLGLKLQQESKLSVCATPAGEEGSKNRIIENHAVDFYERHPGQFLERERERGN